MIFPRRLIGLACLLFGVITARATIGTALQNQLGNPSGATTDPSNRTRYLIQRPQYALDYNDSNREPNWVAWNLTIADTGDSGRSPVFFVDTTLPAGFYRVLTTDYAGSGYDRGHLCPSGDRTVTRADNDATFYMSNMVPQNPDHNQGVWASFETYCRSLAAAGHELLIISGPSGFGGSVIASGVGIPGYVWKIAVVVPIGAGSAVSRIDATTRVIALKVPNIAGVRSNPWQQYVTSVAQLEADTGYTFFTELPPALRAALRTVVDGQATPSVPRLVNLSTRATIGAGDQVAIVGFAITGSEAKTVLIRGVGPGLQGFGVPNSLATPHLELIRGSTLLAANTGWSTADNPAEIATAATRSGAFPLNAGSADSVILRALAPGNYSAIVSSVTATNGTALAEVYELSGESPAQKLANLSTRALAGTGDNALIGGLVIAGSSPKRVLIRAAGPSLTQFGVSGVLTRPELVLRAGDGSIIARNSGWSTSADAAAIAEGAARSGAFAFDVSSQDAALILHLAPGAYTAQVTGLDNTTGIALVEIYEIP